MTSLQTGRSALLLHFIVLGSVSLVGCFRSRSESVEPELEGPGPAAAAPADIPKPEQSPPKTVTPTVPKKAIPIPEAPPEPLHEPTVLLTEHHAETCRVQVGDTMPEISLPDLHGNVQTLSSLYGDRLTVVVFWDTQHIFALEQYLRLQRDTADVFSGFGVSVVAINVGDERSAVEAAAQRAQSSLPCLLDEQGEAMSKVASGKLPRTYVLDTEGKIVWFDIEYSRSTERELRNALYFYLRQTDPGEGALSLVGHAPLPAIESTVQRNDGPG